MKKIIGYSAVVLLIVCAFFACKKMDSTYKEYIVEGGITYAAKVTSPLVYTGRNRIKIAWLRGADPNVIKAKIYWNNLQDSLIVPIPPTGDTISVIIPNLLEKQYNFVVRTYDSKGNSSVPVELLGESFSVNYETLLVTRPVVSAETDPVTGSLAIVWGNANITGGAYATDVQYTDINNVVKVKRFPIAEAISTIVDYKAGTTYQYRTVYIPGTRGIDTFNTSYILEYVSAKVKKAGLVVTADSFAATSQLTANPPGGPPKYAFDDDLGTFWHTHHTPAPVPTFPHWIAVDMVKTYNVTRIELTARPGITGVTNTFTTFTVQGSMNGTTWTDYDSFTLVQKDPVQSFVLATTAKMRYFRIYATAGAAVHTSLAEFTVYGYE